MARAEARKRVPAVLPVAVTGITIWLLLAAPVLRPDRQLGERDTARLFYPVEKVVAAALRAGRMPFWDPSTESGASIVGQVTPAALHPFALLYAALPFGLAFKLHHLLALLLGGIGAALLAVQLGASRWPALVGGIVFGGCGALVSSASGALPYALGPAAAPLAIAGLLWHLRAASPGRLLASAFALSLCAYGGDPQSFGICILVALVLSALAPPRGRRILHVATWAGCGLLLGAPAVLPAISQLEHSERRAGITGTERTMFSAPPVRLVGLLVPLAFDGTEPVRLHESDPYSEFIAGKPAAPFLNSISLGAPALLFAALSARRRRAAPFLVLSALLIVASTGEAWHLQPILEAVIPGWRLFRYTEKFLLHASWLLAVAAAIGADDALLGPEENARPLAPLAIAVAVLAMVALVLGATERTALLDRLTRYGYSHELPVAVRFFDSLQMGILRVAGLSTVIAGLALLRRFRSGSETPAMLAAAAVSASALIAPPLRTVRADLYEGISATAHKLVELGGPSEGRWRVWAEVKKNLPLPEGSELDPDEQRLVGFREAAWPQLQAIDGLDGAATYFSAIDLDYAAVLKDAPDAGLDVLGIRFYVVQPGPDMPASAVRSESGFGILERPPSPRAFVVYGTRPGTTASTLRSIKVFEEAIVPPDGPVLRGSGRAAAVALRRPSPEEIEASVQADAPGLLVLSEHYDPGWRAQVDGRDVPLYRTDLIVLGVPVTAGRHDVRLKFRPEGFFAGAALALLTAVVLGALALRRRVAPP